jgi:hypothetical protein
MLADAKSIERSIAAGGKPEITREMIDAGVSVLQEIRDSCSLDYLVAQVYIAMSVRRAGHLHQVELGRLFCDER